MKKNRIIKQSIKLFFAGLLVLTMVGCSENKSSNNIENVGKSKDDIILDACEKISKAKSFDLEYFFESSPANEYYQYSKEIIKGTMSDVQNLVFDGHYHDEMINNKDDLDSPDNEIIDGPITKKAGEDAIMPPEYNDGHEFYISEDIIKMTAEPYVFVSSKYDESELIEYKIQEEDIEGGKRYTIHGVLKVSTDDGTQEYTSIEDCVYEVNNDGYLVFIKLKSTSPLFTVDNEITDKNRITVTQWKFSNIK